jgi:RNA polymerase sigma factor (sigma-70 family)
MLSERDLIKGCKEYNIKAQQELYERFARKMMGVCYYYTGSTDDAKDLLHEGFIKIFAKFGQYKEEGSLEGWIRRVMVNTAINFLNKKKTQPGTVSTSSGFQDEYFNAVEEEEDSGMNFTQEEILFVINKLPDEYRLIFNMSCLENYSHKEIAELLNIKEDTCRSKLRRAREILRSTLTELYKAREIQKNNLS